MNNKGKSIKINPLKEISPCYNVLSDMLVVMMDVLVIWTGNRDVFLLHIFRM